MRSSFVAPCAAFSVCQPAAPRKVLLSSTNTMPPPRRANIAARYSDVGVLPEPPLPLATAVPLGRVHTFETAILSASSACCAWLGPPMPNWASTPANPPTGGRGGRLGAVLLDERVVKGLVCVRRAALAERTQVSLGIRRTPWRPAAGLAGGGPRRWPPTPSAGTSRCHHRPSSQWPPARHHPPVLVLLAYSRPRPSGDSA